MAKQTLVNFKQVRAEKSVNAPIMIDMDGVEHPVGVFPLDFFLEIVELEDNLGKGLAGEELAAMLIRIKTLISSVLPGFPVGRLTFQEAQELIEALVAVVQPDGASEEAPRDDLGE